MQRATDGKRIPGQMKGLACAAEEERRHTQGRAAAHSQLGLTRDENAAFDNNRVTFDFPDFFVHSAMDVIPSTSRCNSAVNKQFSAVEIELYYLIAKYLSSGPCKKAYEVLRAEIEENQLLPKRHDWLGNEHRKSLDEVDRQLGHLSNDHLLRVVSRLGPAINQLVKLPYPTAATLLGAGTQSLLRTENDLYKSYKTLSNVVVRHRGYPPLEPVRYLGPPCLTQTILGRELQGTINYKHVVTNKFYSRIQLYFRSVGHLSAVYCMLFDRTGKYIITGADDTLVKIWSTFDGRLMATLRGASAEISDLAIDGENSLIAAGSCDKIIRVWSLQTLAPVAVLSSHTGMITALQFCPAPDSEGVLVSTGGDGCVAFWTYTRRSGETKFDSKPLKVNERVRPGNAQLICASFSAGGHFLAVGGADHFVRVYHLGGEDGVEKLIETERHQDRVDSIQWCHKGLMFVSGSRDGTALVWRYETQQWKNLVLNMTDRLPGDSPPSEEIRRLQVTMVGWNRSDEYVITASNDKWLRVWDSNQGKLKHILRGHEDNSYVIEAHPLENNIILTAAHDGQLMIWDISTGTLVRSFKNTIEGQGYGALFDAKWSPDGYTIATTDSHGHLILFGIGHNEKFKKIPKELFFHTDYRPLVRDANNHVLDEQTQMAPHLMPPPFLVNMDGDPYPPEYQRLVPGRENCRHDQLIPNVLLNANGDQEVLDAALQDYEHPPANAPPPPPAPEAVGGQRPNIDEMIERLAQEQDQRIAHNRRPSDPGLDQPGPSNVRERRESSSTRGERRASSGGPPTDHSYAVAALHDPLSPRASRAGTRRIGDVEGVRQSTGNWQRDPNMKWNRRIIIRQQQHSNIKQNLNKRRVLGEYELQLYDEESSKKPEPVKSPEQQQHEAERKTRKKQKKQTHSYSTRSVRDSRRGGYEGQEFEEAENPPGSSSPGTSSGTEIENEELQESSSSDDQSTDYSDWTADAGFSLEPPKRTAHKQKKSIRKRRKGRLTSDDDDDKENKDDDDDDDDDDEDDMEKRKSASTPRVQRKLRGPRPNLSELNGAADEIPEEYRPPEWLTETFPKKAPYFPQMGDELIYFMQGHMLYVEAVMNRKLYTIDKRSLPWMRTTNKLRDQEFVKIIGIKYEIKPPRLCCLKLGIMDLGRGKLTSDSFTIKYHDMPDVLDFLILKATYNYAMSRHWKKGDRFRCIIDDAWWLGTVESHEPHLPEFPDSMFMCYRVLWDNGEEERLSPWDMELIDENMEAMERGGSVAVKPKELEELLYRPQSEEWVGRNPDQECDRISHGLSLIMTLAIAEPFLVPVDLNAYPMYALTIDYPMDLTTIKSRLDNRFYRRINAVQFDVRYLATNTEKFNQKGSNIVRQARIVTELCLKLIKDDTCIDPTPLYHELQANYHSPDHSDEDPTGDNRGGLRGEGKGGHSKGLRGRGQATVEKRSWQQMCRDLLRSIFEKEDSIPFRFPVDLERYPDYSQVIDIPMDLTTVREELSASGYSTPHDFAKDVRLIFTNSKNYNTNKRSRIYSMTLRLEAYFEDQIKPILASYKSKDGASASVGERRSPVTSTAFGRPVVPPHRAEYSLSTTFEEENHIEEEEEEDIMDSSLFSNTDGARRSRRVARKKLMNSNDDDDSGEEYNPRNRKKKSSSKAKKKGVATRNRGRVTVQYKEESEDEYLSYKNKNSGGTTKKKNVVESESNDNSSGCDIPGPSTKRTNGQIFGMKSRLESSSDEESEEECDSKGKSNGVNGVDSRKQARQVGVGKVTQPKSSEDSEDSSGSSSLSEDEGNDYSKDQSKGKLGYVKRRQSTSDSSSSSVGKAHPKGKSKGQIPPTTKGKPVNIKRYNKEESEVEFDDEDLESSTEESAEDDLNSRRGRKRGVASSVRRARKIILDGDDEDDQDFIVDKDFIDDADMTEEESSSQSDSDEGSEENVKHVKKKDKKKAKQSKKKMPVKKNAKKSQPKKSNTKKKSSTNAKTSKKAQPPSKRPQPKNVQELITVNRPGQSPIPYQPLSYGSQIVTVVDQIEHRGRVFGRVITSTCGENDHGDEEEEEESESEDSESEESSEGYPAPPYSKGKGKLMTNPANAKRSYESDSEYESTKSKKSKKRPRYSEEEENEEVDVSSRGRVRKANTLMRDFI
ncbi:bromodomain and WD repeat-containing protein 3-like isoform X2 [Penaeus japonicus]|uniref:bromodomain and WD repeat-containing protein 3-like isoform X2 n=1 Tax=Penaeus japonicus TaxID=27405 RepID=UPI001C711FFE|nr:bromodomain and WD repeat-containing protein 3-like isoform X2 [Penaeus japonicus]